MLKLNTVKNFKDLWKLAKAINYQQTLLSINAELDNLVDHSLYLKTKCKLTFFMILYNYFRIATDSENIVCYVNLY